MRPRCSRSSTSSSANAARSSTSTRSCRPPIIKHEATRDQNMNASRIYAIVLNPWVVIGSLALGGAVGLLLPGEAQKLAFIGDIYVDLLKMTTLPFMISAVIFSLQRLFRDGGTSRLLMRVLTVFVSASAIVALVGAVVLLVLNPGANLSNATMQTFGLMVGSDATSSDTVMNLYGADLPQKTLNLADVLTSLVPTNIFAALANGDALKALVFALLFV